MSDASLAAFAPPLPARRETPRPVKPGGRRRGDRPTMDWQLLPGLWLRRLRERRFLARMSVDYPSYLLRDVGLRREDLMREAAKPFWRT